MKFPAKQSKCLSERLKAYATASIEKHHSSTRTASRVRRASSRSRGDSSRPGLHAGDDLTREGDARHGEQHAALILCLHKIKMQQHLVLVLSAAARAARLVKAEQAAWLEVGSMEWRSAMLCMLVAATMSMAACRKCASTAAASSLGTCSHADPPQRMQALA